MSSRAKGHDRTVRPVVCRLWIKPQTCDFHDFFSHIVADGSFTADGGLLQPTGCVRITLHTSIFSLWKQCEHQQGIHGVFVATLRLEAKRMLLRMAMVSGENLTLKQMFEISEQWTFEQSDEIFGESQNQLGKFSMETVISGQWWRSHQSLACKDLCILRFCVMCWKDASEANIKYCLGATVGMVQRFITIQKFGHNRRRTNGIRVEYFPGFTILQLVHEIQKFMSKMGEPELFQGRIIIMSMFNDIIWWYKDNETECIANSTLVSLFAKRFPAGRSSFLGPGAETKWYSTNKERPGGKWDRFAELMMIKFRESGHPVFPSHESIVQRSAQKQRWWKIVDTLSVPTSETIKTVFRTITSVNQLSLYGAVAGIFEEYESVHDRTVRPVVRTVEFLVCAKCDQDKRAFEKWWSCTLIISIAKIQRTSGKACHNQNRLSKDLYWCRIPENSWSRTILHDKTYWRVLTIHRFSGQSWVYFTTRWKIQLTRKVGSEGTPKLGPYWKLQPFAY